MLQLHNRIMAVPRVPPFALRRPSSPDRAPALPEWVGLKWLMGLQGRRVDVGRLQCDSAYAQACLDEACGCADPALRDYAQRLRQRLAA